MSGQGFCAYSTRGTGILPSTTCASRRAPRRRTYPRSRLLTPPPMRPPRDRQGPVPASREGRGKPALRGAGPGKRSRPPAPQGQGPLGGTWKGRRMAWIAGEAGQGSLRRTRENWYIGTGKRAPLHNGYTRPGLGNPCHILVVPSSVKTWGLATGRESVRTTSRWPVATERNQIILACASLSAFLGLS